MGSTSMKRRAGACGPPWPLPSPASTSSQSQAVGQSAASAGSVRPWQGLCRVQRALGRHWTRCRGPPGTQELSLGNREDAELRGEREALDLG